MSVWTCLWNEALRSALINFAGFLLALWYARSRVVDKKSISKSYLRYFQDLFPFGMMLLGIYFVYVASLVLGSVIMTLSAFIYVVSYVAPSVDKYDNTHRATILSLGYTRQEYAIRYLFPKSKKFWFAATANFFIAQWIILMWFDVLKNEKIQELNVLLLLSSIVLMAFGILISVLRNFKER